MEKDRPINHGKKWTTSDRSKLYELYKLGRSYSELANHFERSTLSIELQLREIFISNLLETRNIKHLKHFTDKRNLFSIQKYGLLPIKSLVSRGIKYYHNDEKRLDNLQDGVCFSVSNINKYLLNTYKSRFPQKEWIEIIIDAQALIKSRCLYFSSNAAKSSFSKLREDYELSTPKAFEAMFADSIPTSPYATRAGKGLDQTTCDQAEVIILGSIGKSKILGWNQL